MCKKHLIGASVKYRELGGAWRRLDAKVFYHPKGCMGASTSHLDIVGKIPGVLRDVLFVRGTKASCSMNNRFIIISLGLADVRVGPIPLDVVEGDIQGFTCYLFRKRDGIYVSMPV